MHIWQLAKVTGVTIKAIRHYENVGLLEAAQKNGDQYLEPHIHVIKLIKMAQSAGFSLKEIFAFLSARQTQNSIHIDHAFEILHSRGVELEKKDPSSEQITLIDKLKKELADFVKSH